MTDGPGLLIGEFARRCRLPVSTLRYYDRLGLLTPAVVDTLSGYRRYDVCQVPTAELVSRLRGLGVAPQGIAAVLAGGSEASAALRAERIRIADAVDQGRRRLADIDALLDVGGPESHHVEVVELSWRQVAVHRFTVSFPGLEMGVVRAIGALRSALRRSGGVRLGPWSGSFPLDLTDEVSGFVFAAFAGENHVAMETVALPAGHAVSTIHRGCAATLSQAYRAAFAELDRLGEAARAPVIEEYLDLDEDQPGGRIRLSLPFGA